MEALRRVRAAKKIGVAADSPFMLHLRKELEIESAAGKLRSAASKAERDAKNRKPVQMRLFLNDQHRPENPWRMDCKSWPGR